MSGWMNEWINEGRKEGRKEGMLQHNSIGKCILLLVFAWNREHKKHDIKNTACHLIRTSNNKTVTDGSIIQSLYASPHLIFLGKT